MLKKNLFIIGSGRSGTTLMQRVLNTFPQVLIWGEHGGALEDIAKSYYHLKNDESIHQFCYQRSAPKGTVDLLSFYKNPKHWQAWINWFEPNDLKPIFRNLIENMFCPSHLGNIEIWGFKEIRYHESDQVLDFLLELYPDSHFIITTRDGLNTVSSQLLTFYQGATKWGKIKRLFELRKIIQIARNWDAQNRYYLKFAQENTENVQLLHFEDFIKDIFSLQPTLKKLGLKISPTQQDIMSLKSGRGSNSSPDKENERWKTLGWFPSFIVEIIVGNTCENLKYSRPVALNLATKISNLLTIVK